MNAPAPATTPRAAGSGLLGGLEYALRLAFFAIVPSVVVVLAELVPMTAAILNIGLALAAFFFGEILRKHAEKRTWLGRILRRQLAFEEYYREHPPKPFLYYLAYPILLPYWLVNREARREFWLFKGYTLVTVLLVALSGAYRLFFVYGPELGPKDFVGPFLIGLVVESLAVLLLIMPMTTSVVALHQSGQRRRLVALLAVGLVSAAVAGARLALRHRTFPSLETRYRVGHRSLRNPQQAEQVIADAVKVAWKKRHEGGWGREDDGTLAGPPLDAARHVLEKFYRPDEAAAFELWTSARKERPQLMVLYAEGPRHGRPVYLGVRPDGTIVKKVADIPKSARKMMFTVGELGRWDDL
jgi:hypothetical protein